MGKDNGQVSEVSQMTPEGGAEGTPGTEEGTPAAADTQHAPHEGPKDYTDADATRATDSAAGAE
ncbi:hypothetical protein [Mobilicoccus pelagius]|uniref:Uncharacterized protein n=1 Tax=Mobilicoccus pelagius NBRC 104925 TaxID=1089455 RepID=H5UW14_9MICO|nr:hypothetical protein [Mobilicoccus pelagius]GAB49922.1 hypothetical protein MOPEL_135_01600 [Mobilicoccus pelagius NBRC 104925]